MRVSGNASLKKLEIVCNVSGNALVKSDRQR